jgi:SlyX protein
MTDPATINARPPDARIDELELHLAHQGQMIEELSKTVTEQWKMIDRLVQRLGLLDNRMRTVEESVPDAKGAEPPPPHY